MKNVKIANLFTSNKSILVEECEVCVVGAGAAGIYLAVELTRQGIDTILLEAGDLTSIDPKSAGFSAFFEDELYSGATKGRFFGLGGTTSHWGGILVPHTKYDVKRDNKCIFNTWGHIVNIVNSRGPSVLKKLGWNRKSEFTDFIGKKNHRYQKLLQILGIGLVLDLSLPFRKKNFSFLLRKLSKSNFKLRIFINSVVYDWEAISGDCEGRVQAVKVKSSNNNQLSVKANKFIISAGTIESARILLELNQSTKGMIIKDTAEIGCYLTDHISLPVAKLSKDSAVKAIKSFSPRFSHGWMRSFRFIDDCPDNNMPRSFFHFIFKNDSVGFSLAKEFLTSIQSSRWPKVSIQDLVLGVVGIIKLGIFKYVYSGLYIPKNADIYLQLDVEQCPNKENRVTLGEELDKYGRNVVNIKWKISENDIKNIKFITEKFFQKWQSFEGVELNTLKEDQNIAKPFDAYHPVGTCSMGKNKESVVDENLKVWGVENLWVVSTGVLPSAGTANPTFTMLCLAEELIGKIAINGV